VKPKVDVEILPHSALVEVDRQARGRGFVTLEVTETFRIRVSRWVRKLRRRRWRRSRSAAILWRAGHPEDAAEYAEQLRAGSTPLANRVQGDVWRRRGSRDQATRYYAMYLSLADNPPDEPEIRACLSQPKDSDITVPAR